MASINKPGGGINLAFAARNEDVRLILVGLKEKKVNLTDYVCNAIRFYEENKDKSNSNVNIAELVKLEVEKQLQAELPKKEWSLTHHLLIFHGRRMCIARNPKCGECPFTNRCKYFKEQKAKKH